MASRGGQTFEKQRERDLRKIKIARSEEVTIIEIPEVPAVVSIADVPILIERELKKAGIRPLTSAKEIKIDINRIFNRSVLEDLQRIAKDRGGHLLNDRYLGDQATLEWRCGAGHEWKAKVQPIRSGTWCPFCYGNIRKSLDDIKTLAKERGIKLLSTEYRGTNGKLKWLCPIGHKWETTPKKIQTAATKTGCPRCAGQIKTIEDMNEIVRAHGGRCVSKKYLGLHRHLEWECREGHRFKATPNIAGQKKGAWCPECRKKKFDRTLQEKNQALVEKMLVKNKGIFISGRTQRGSSRIRVRCSVDHEWETRVSQILRGAWCLRCASGARALKTRLGIPAMQEIAKKRGGVCLSKDDINQYTKLLFRCKIGHEWEAAPNNIKAGKWCPFCAGRRKTADDMHQLAAKREFKFLSSAYLGDAKHHRWECQHGHQWAAQPSNIIQGRGCPTCALRRPRRNKR
jgi:hypothetical protein